MPKILYYNSHNQLCLEKTPLVSVCRKESTPFFIYSRAEIENNCREILKIGREYDFLPCYALKANYNPQLIKIIHRFGFGADVVSGGELYFARKIGIPVQKIVFAGIGKTLAEIETAIKAGIHSINIESDAELKSIDTVSRRLKRKVTLAIRINPDIDPRTHPYISTGLLTNKFGIGKDQALRLYLKLKGHPYIQARGMHVHIGSQITSRSPYLQTAKSLLELHRYLHGQGVTIEFIDLGGGIGLNYKDQLDTAAVPRTYIAAILPVLLACFKNQPVRLMMEIGRGIIGSAGILVSKVTYVKTTPLKKFVIVDSGMNNLIRPSLYQAHHQVLPLVTRHKPKEKVDVVGPVCETSDFFARDRRIEKLYAGDFIAITGAGAYAQAISSNYNLRPTLAEYLVHGTGFKKIFKGESIKDIASRYNWK